MPQQPFALGPALRTTLLLGTLHQRLAQLIQGDVVLAEVELALARLGEVGRGDVFEIANRLVEPPVLLVHQAAEPGHHPGIGRHLRPGRVLQRGSRVVEPALSQLYPGPVERAITATELFNLGERGFGLAQLTASALAQEANAVVVPALPWIDPRRRIVRRRRDALDRKGNAVARKRDHRQGILRAGIALEVLDVGRVELAVLQPDLDLDRSLQAARHREREVHGVGRTRWNLVVVERREDVLGIAPVDAVAVAIEHVDVDEMRPRVDRAVGVHPAAAAHDPIAAFQDDVQPELVGICGVLGQRVPHLDGANHRFEQVSPAGLEHRDGRTQRRQKLPVDVAAGLQAEQVHPHHPVQEFQVRLVHPAGVIQQLRQGRVGSGELVIMNLEDARAVEAASPEVARAHQRHVAGAAPVRGRRRVVKRLREIARHAAQEVRVVVVLPAHPLVVVQLLGQVDLVAG